MAACERGQGRGKRRLPRAVGSRRSSNETLSPTGGWWEVVEAGALAPDLEGAEDDVTRARRGEDEEAAGKHGRKKKVCARRE